VSHRLIPLEARDEWTRALDGVPHAFAHSWESCHAMHLSTGHATMLYVFERDGARVVCPIAERVFDGATDVVTPYGFSGFTSSAELPGFPAAWRAFAADRGWVCGYIALHPVLERASLYDPRDAVHRTELYLLDIADEAAMYARLSENRRRELKAWNTDGAELVTDREPLAAFVLAEHDAFFTARGAGSAYRLGSDTWRALFAAENVVLLGIRLAGRIVAVSIFGVAPGVAEYLFNVSVDDGRRFGAPLIWEGVRRLRARGLAVLDLGGGVQPGDGVARFKQRFGARRVPFTTLRQVYDPERYRALCDGAAVDPADRAGFFPPYRSPR
jgi:GNAT acetyltransferase-like protein